MTSDDCLILENQLCFPLYVASKEIIKRYRPFLETIDLTYTQYITMLVLWEKKSINVKDLGKRLFLDSGTLTPLLKSLEAKGLVNRTRSTNDERIMLITITEKGNALKEKAQNFPVQMSSCIKLSAEESSDLCRLLKKILG